MVVLDILITDELITILMIATTFSVILMPLIQRFKRFHIIKNDVHIFILNMFLSFSVGILFAIYFYELTVIGALWVGFFSFIEAPAIYHLLKKQNIINYTPKALAENHEYLKVPVENKIKRNEVEDEIIR